MKKTFIALNIAMLSSVFVFMSCNSPAEKVEESKENVVEKQYELDEAKKEHAEQYRKFRENSRKEITANEQLIADLRMYSIDKKKDLKIEYENQISELEAKNERLKVKLNDLKKEDHEKWESFKKEFKHDMNELKESLQDLGKNNVK